MKKTILAASTAATLGLSILAAPVALAGGRQPVTIEVGKACGVVTLTFANPELNVGKVHGFRWNAVAGDVATGDGARTGLVTVDPGKTVEETVRFAEDEFDGVGALTVGHAFGPDGDIQPKLDIYPVDTDCTDEEPTPDPTAPPVTTTPQTPEPEPVDLNCVDFPLPDGRTAQDVLDETPGEDPHGLDANGNRIPCEVPDVDTEPVDSDNDITVVVPRGGVNTGGGPA